ncbi:MAG: hypothetical protein NT014_07415 [Candidatus Omnitrophica bacterium]|nr:hypothetical protein [Candidatus Omnitrophota bacterium]
MLKKENRTTKQDVLRKIEAILKEDVDMETKSVFAKIEKFLEPIEKTDNSSAGGIGYVQIDEKLKAEYLAWEENIKQEWFEAIENIRKNIRDK